MRSPPVSSFDPGRPPRVVTLPRDGSQTMSKHAVSRARDAALEEILSERIMILDGAMGSMIYAHEPTEDDYRGQRLREPPDRPQELHRGPGPDAAEDDRGDPPRLPRGRRRHHRDRHVQRNALSHGRVRPGGPRRRAEPRPPPSSPAAPPTTFTRRTPEQAAVRRRQHRADQEAALDGHPRRRPGPPRRDLRPDGRQLHRAGPRPGRRAASTSCCPRPRSTRWS